MSPGFEWSVRSLPWVLMHEPKVLLIEFKSLTVLPRMEEKCYHNHCIPSTWEVQLSKEPTEGGSQAFPERWGRRSIWLAVVCGRWPGQHAGRADRVQQAACACARWSLSCEKGFNQLGQGKVMIFMFMIFALCILKSEIKCQEDRCEDTVE